LADPARWAARAYAQTIEGKSVQAEDKRAVRWCASGAIDKCYGWNTPMQKEAWWKANTLARSRHTLPLSHVNDRLGYLAVKQLLEDLDI
jgi:hypothetical protein